MHSNNWIILTLLLIGITGCFKADRLYQVEKAVAEKNPDQKKNLVFLLLRPDDCPSCYGNVSRHLEWLTSRENYPADNLFIVMNPIGKDQREYFLNNVVQFDPATHPVLFRDSLFQEVQNMLPDSCRNRSSIAVYDPEFQYLRGTILKSLSSTEALEDFIR